MFVKLFQITTALLFFVQINQATYQEQLKLIEEKLETESHTIYRKTLDKYSEEVGSEVKVKQKMELIETIKKNCQQKSNGENLIEKIDKLPKQYSPENDNYLVQKTKINNLVKEMKIDLDECKQKCSDDNENSNNSDESDENYDIKNECQNCLNSLTQNLISLLNLSIAQLNEIINFIKNRRKTNLDLIQEIEDVIKNVKKYCSNY